MGFSSQSAASSKGGKDSSLAMQWLSSKGIVSGQLKMARGEIRFGFVLVQTMGDSLYLEGRWVKIARRRSKATDRKAVGIYSSWMSRS
jgi:diphthamide synthase (EF-2-diphthine--ammonia ligase)